MLEGRKPRRRRDRERAQPARGNQIEHRQRARVVPGQKLRLLVLALPKVDRHERNARPQILLGQSDADARGVRTGGPIVNLHHNHSPYLPATW